jgi:aspartate 1-decarboxylase
VCWNGTIGNGAILKNIIASYASYNEAEVKNYTPTLCYVDANNVLTQIKATL